MRRNGDDTPTEGTPPTPPPPTSTGTGNPFTKWFIGAAAFLLVIIGVPALIWAQTDSSTVNVSVDAIKSLQQQINDVQKLVQQMMGGGTTSGEGYANVSSFTNVTGSTCAGGRACLSCRSDRTRNKCVNSCIFSPTDGILACLNKIPGVLPENTESIFNVGIIKNAAAPVTPTLQTCVINGNNCITACEKDISCEDRAAAWYDACLSWVAIYVKDETKAVAARALCGKIDRQLVLQYCSKQGLMEPDLTSDFCTDQCCRVESICSSSLLTYSKYWQDACRKLGEQCRTQGCPGGTTPGCTQEQKDVCKKNYDAGPTYNFGNTTVNAYQGQYDECLKTCQWPTTPICTADQIKICNDNYLKQAEAVGATEDLKGSMNKCLTTCQWPGSQCTDVQVKACNDDYLKYSEALGTNLKGSLDICLAECQWPSSQCTDVQITGCNKKYAEAGGTQAALGSTQTCLTTCQWPSQPSTQTSCSEENLAMCKTIYDKCYDQLKSTDKCGTLHTSCQNYCSLCSATQLGDCYNQFIEAGSQAAASAGAGYMNLITYYDTATFDKCLNVCGGQPVIYTNVLNSNLLKAQ